MQPDELDIASDKTRRTAAAVATIAVATMEAEASRAPAKGIEALCADLFIRML
jgi:hypothetical protein